MPIDAIRRGCPGMAFFIAAQISPPSRGSDYALARARLRQCIKAVPQPAVVK